MAIPRNIKQYLFHNNVTYSRKTHDVAYTSQEIAEVEGVPGAEFAKAVMLEADGQMIMAVLPADHVINLDILKRQIGCGKLALAPERQFSEMFPSCEAGAMPPFGKLFRLPLHCDVALSKHPDVEFNAGTHIDTIRMSYDNFVRLENPAVSSFSEKRIGQYAARIA